jgi:hypothetical protein
VAILSLSIDRDRPWIAISHAGRPQAIQSLNLKVNLLEVGKQPSFRTVSVPRAKLWKKFHAMGDRFTAKQRYLSANIC